MMWCGKRAMGRYYIALVVISLPCAYYLWLQSQSNQRIGADNDWKLLLDFDCWKLLEQNKTCKLPLKVGVLINSSNKLNHRIFEVSHFIEKNAVQDFVWFRPTKKPNKTRIMVDFPIGPLQSIPVEDGSNIPVRIPLNQSKFLRKWKKSEFIECSGVGAKNRSKDTTRVIPLSAVRNVMAEFRDFCDENNKTAYLMDGSLLGWYRECSIIPHTTDIDMGMATAEYSEEFEKKIEKRYWVYWMQGAGNTTSLITYKKDDVKMDLFFIFKQNATHDQMRGFYVPDKREVRWIYPKLTGICSANLLNTLMYVPCNALEYIKMGYGPNWAVDRPSSHYEFSKSGSNISPESPHFNETEWAKVYRPKRA